MRRRHINIFVLTILLGCGATVPQAARKVLTASSRAFVVADSAAALKYTDAADKALQEAASAQEYRHLMEPWDKVEQAIRVGRSSLLATEGALDFWDSTGDKTNFLASAKVLAEALESLSQAMEAAGVPVPPAVHEALNLAQKFGGSL